MDGVEYTVPPRRRLPRGSRLSGVYAGVLESIRRHGLAPGGGRVLVAVSGGADSVALLRILDELVASGLLDAKLVVGHLDHGLREGSAEDARFVTHLAEGLGLEVDCDRADVRGLMQREGMGLEEAARRCRYEFFRRAALRRECTRVATAHTLDDQAETVLMNLLRGAAAEGLSGIPRRRRMPGEGAIEVVRPLLEVSRRDLETYLRELGQPWREDPTNRQCTFRRNDIRHRVLPELERLYPNVRQQLSRTAAFFEEVSADLEARCRRTWPTVVEHRPEGFRVRREGVIELGAPAGKSLLRRVCLGAGVPGDKLGRARLEALWEMVCRGEAGAMELAGGVRVEVQRGVVWVRGGSGTIPT